MAPLARALRRTSGWRLSLRGILQMRELEAEGLAWEYETYSLFELPKPGRSPGYAQIAAAFPPEALQRLQEAGKRYWWRDGKLPGTPDLFAYSREGNEVIPARFVELKRGDSLASHQLLGMALIQEILETPVHVVRYVPVGSNTRPRVYSGAWPRGGYIPPP